MGFKKVFFICLTATAILAINLIFPLHVKGSEGNCTLDKTVILYSYDTHGDEKEYEAIKAHKDDLEKSGYEVILVDVGGFYDSDWNSVKFMNSYGYDIVMPSGDDFSQGCEVLKNNLCSSRFYVLCSNIRKGGKYLYKPRRIITTKSGKRIGFIGCSSVSGNVENIEVLEGDVLNSCLQEDINDLKKGNVDAIVMLGYGEDIVKIIEAGGAKAENNKKSDSITSENKTDNEDTKNSINKTEDVDKSTSTNKAERNAAVEDKNNATSDNNENSNKNSDTVSDNNENSDKNSDTVSDNSEDEENGTINDNQKTASLYEVIKGDSLWKISSKVYGKQIVNRWKEIFDLNKDKISDHSKVYVGQEFELPE